MISRTTAFSVEIGQTSGYKVLTGLNVLGTECGGGGSETILYSLPVTPWKSTWQGCTKDVLVKSQQPERSDVVWEWLASSVNTCERGGDVTGEF